MHTGEKISGEFVITCGDGTEVFELIEKSFDKVAFAVEREIARSRGFAVGLGRDDRSDSPLDEGSDEWVCVVRLVANAMRLDRRCRSAARRKQDHELGLA